MEKYENFDTLEQSTISLKIFTGLVVVSQAFGIAAIMLTAIWMAHFRGGFSWQNNPGLEFNYHPLFMVIGMVFLYGDAILAYRVLRNERKIIVKIIHASLLAGALLFAGVGLKAVFDSHNLAKPTPMNNMYTLHSWMGISTVVMFGLQWVCGLVTFLVPGLSARLRELYKPSHVFWGVVIYIMAIATALVGITEKSIFSNTEYSKLNEEGILANVLGAVLVVMAVIVVYIVTNSNFQRPPMPDEQQPINHSG